MKITTNRLLALFLGLGLCLSLGRPAFADDEEEDDDINGISSPLPPQDPIVARVATAPSRPRTVDLDTLAPDLLTDGDSGVRPVNEWTHHDDETWRSRRVYKVTSDHGHR